MLVHPDNANMVKINVALDFKGASQVWGAPFFVENGFPYSVNGGPGLPIIYIFLYFRLKLFY
jgi:hypothetical protein